MPDVLSTPTAQTGFALLILCVLITFGFYLVASFRDYAADDQDVASEALANLEEMRSKGDISDADFRTIQATTHRPPARSITEDGSPPSGESNTNSQV